MAVLEKLWDIIGFFFSGLLRGFERGVTALFGSSNQRILNRYKRIEEGVNDLESR